MSLPKLPSKHRIDQWPEPDLFVFVEKTFGRRAVGKALCSYQSRHHMRQLGSGIQNSDLSFSACRRGRWIFNCREGETDWKGLYQGSVLTIGSSVRGTSSPRIEIRSQARGLFTKLLLQYHPRKAMFSINSSQQLISGT
jgi:hypothetical protein